MILATYERANAEISETRTLWCVALVSGSHKSPITPDGGHPREFEFLGTPKFRAITNEQAVALGNCTGQPGDQRIIGCRARSQPVGTLDCIARPAGFRCTAIETDTGELVVWTKDPAWHYRTLSPPVASYRCCSLPSRSKAAAIWTADTSFP
jgi:hypothetical protein